MSNTISKSSIIGKSHRVTLIVAIFALATASVLFLFLGFRPITPTEMVDAISNYDQSIENHVIFREIRLPRLLAALIAGGALGAAGALMQAMTRNPLADPGLLGINAGASLGVVISIAILGITNPADYIWVTLSMALLLSVLVFLIGGKIEVSPLRLVVAGAALSALCFAAIRVVLLLSRQTLDTYRFWVLGGLDEIQFDTILSLSPFFLGGFLMALISSFWLNVLIVGTDTAKALGLRVFAVQTVTNIAIILLCGATVAMAGPISFIGLFGALIAQRFAGADVRWRVFLSALFGTLLVVFADLLGRLPIFGGNMQAGVITALIGGPVLIVAIWNKGLKRL